MLEPIFNQSFSTLKIKIIGVGGAGGCFVSHLARHFEYSQFSSFDMEFLYIDTELSVLERYQESCSSLNTLHIGKELCDSHFSEDKGKLAAESDKSLITEHLLEADVVLLIVGMGGIVGNSAAATIADIAKAHGSRTICIATIPFSFELRRPRKRADKCIRTLSHMVDSLILIPLDVIKKHLWGKMTRIDDFNKVRDVIAQIVLGSSDSTTFDEISRLDLLSQQAVLVGKAFMNSR